MDEKMDIMPQKPRGINYQQIVSKPGLFSATAVTEISIGRAGADLIPFSSVIRSARCRALINEKCPVSEASNIFCLSIAITYQ